MNKKASGFTLIELLIVIAIIGILAAVLIPNLLGARVSANKKAGQAHSANVYKAVTAELAENPTNTIASVIAAYGANCKPARSITSTTRYGWAAAPGAVDTCTITDGTTDFTVTVKMDAGSGGGTSVNGSAP